MARLRPRVGDSAPTSQAPLHALGEGQHTHAVGFSVIHGRPHLRTRALGALRALARSFDDPMHASTTIP
jgi:hypothetical protein